jgi:hypothetical protein
MKTRIRAVRPWALLALVLLLVSSFVQAADEQTYGAGRRRRRSRRRSTAATGAAANIMVPITFLNSSVEKGAGMYGALGFVSSHSIICSFLFY